MNEADKEEFSPRDSLLLIQSMIERSRHNMSDNSFYFLFWGWLVFGVLIAQYILLEWVHYPYHYILWALMPVGGIITAVYSHRQSKRELVRTYVTDSMRHLWMGIGLSFWVMMVILGKKGIPFILPFSMLLYGMGTFISGLFLQMKLLRWSGLIVLALAGFCAYQRYPDQMLVCALAVAISHIVPGHYLRIMYSKHK